MDSPVKATDFGLSIRHRPEDAPLKSRSGTPAYMAPEVRQMGGGGETGPAPVRWWLGWRGRQLWALA